MPSRAELKQDAKQKIKAAKPSMYLTTFYYFLVSIPITVIYFVFYFNNSRLVRTYGRAFFVSRNPLLGFLVYIVFIAIMMLIFVGYLWYAMKVSRSQPAEFKNIFDTFRMPLKVFCLTFMIYLFTFLWSLLLFIPGIIAMYRYRQAFFILYDHPDYGVMQCINESKQMMKGHKAELFVLDLSFLGWCLLGVITLYVLYIWLSPYLVVTYANYYNELCKGYYQKVIE